MVLVSGFKLQPLYSFTFYTFILSYLIPGSQGFSRERLIIRHSDTEKRHLPSFHFLFLQERYNNITLYDHSISLELKQHSDRLIYFCGEMALVFIRQT